MIWPEVYPLGHFLHGVQQEGERIQGRQEGKEMALAVPEVGLKMIALRSLW
ncbi:MAG: hypothetical protein ACYDEV_08305 [Acidiferrobacter sp.]